MTVVDTAQVALADIVMRERTRSDLGDIRSLAESIKQRGLFHPPVIRRDGDDLVLVAGSRRIAALRHLGIKQVTVTVAHDIDDEITALIAEGEENTERKDFVPSEAVRHGERLRDRIEADAKARKAQAPGLPQGQKVSSSKLDEETEPVDRRTDARLAKASGMGRSSYRKAAAVVSTVDDESQPEPVRLAAAEAVVEMDRSGNVDAAHRKVQQAKADAEPDPLGEYLADDQNLADLNYLTRFTAALARSDDFALFDAERIGLIADDDVMISLGHLAESAQRFQDIAKRARSGLRSIAGGQK